MLSKKYILKILLFLVTVNGQNKVTPGVGRSRSTTANLVANLRRQLMQNNYDYVESRELPPAAPARPRAPYPQPAVRIQTYRKKPSTTLYTNQFVQSRLSSPTPRQTFDKNYNRPQGPELRSDFEDSASRYEPPRRQPTTRAKYQKPADMLPPVNTDYRNADNSPVRYTGSRYTRKRQIIVNRQPNPDQYRPQRAQASLPRTIAVPEHTDYQQLPNIRVKYTEPSQTSQPPPLPQSRTRKVKIRTVKISRATTTPVFEWVEEGDPFEPARDAAPPLVRKYLRASDDGQPGHPNNSSIKFSLLTFKKKRAYRRGGLASRRMIQEESPAGLMLLVLDDEPLPEFQLPAALRQYMEGSASHEYLHELN